MKDRFFKSLKLSCQWLQTRIGEKVIIAVVLLTFVNQSTEILKSGIRYNFQSRSDFEDYYEASKRLNANEDLYRVESIQKLAKTQIQITDLTVEKLIELLFELKATGAYLYPPFFAWVLTPLSDLQYKSAAIIYQIISISALLLFLMFFWRLLDSRNRDENQIENNDKNQSLSQSISRNKVISLVIALALYSPFLSSNASNGNVGFFILLLCGVGLVWSFHVGFFSSLNINQLKINGRKRNHVDVENQSQVDVELQANVISGILSEFVGGFLIGVATIIKIMPAFLTGVLAAGRRYIALIGFIFGILFSVLIPATTIGFANNLDKHRQWYSFLIESYQKYSVVRPYANNQTISAALSKLMISGSDQKQEKYGLPLFEVDLNHTQPLTVSIRIINLALVGSLALLILFIWWRRPIQLKSVLTNTSFSALISVSMLTALVSSGVSWYHTYSLLLIPLTLRLSQVTESSQSIESLFTSKNRAEQFAYLAPAILPLVFAILPNRIYEALSLYSLYTWVACISIYLHQVSLWKYALSSKNS